VRSASKKPRPFLGFRVSAWLKNPETVWVFLDSSGKFGHNTDMENRKSERLTLRLPIFYTLDPNTPWIGPIVLDDIGGGGLKFESNKPIPKDTSLQLKIDLPDGNSPILFKGVVTWGRQSSPSHWDIGIKFHKMKHRDRQRYLTYNCENILNQFLTNEGKVAAK
jgi:hypothetical protein